MERKFTVIICSVVLAAALLFIWLRLRPATPKIDHALIINSTVGVGEALAEETAKAIHGQGRIVLVTDRDPHPNDTRWTALQETLKRHDAISIAAVEVVREDPADGMPGCPLAAFTDLIARHAGMDAIVFLLDLPEWARVNGQLPPRTTPVIIALDQNNASLKQHYRGYFENNFLFALLGARSTTGPATEPRTPHEWFTKYYEVYDPNNYSSLPD